MVDDDVGEGRALLDLMEVGDDLLGVEALESPDLRAHCDNSSIGNGNMMVEFFSALIELSVCR